MRSKVKRIIREKSFFFLETKRRFLNENPKLSSYKQISLSRTHSSIKRTRDTHTNSSMSSSLAGGGGGGNGGFLGGMRGLTKFVEKIRNCANQVYNSIPFWISLFSFSFSLVCERLCTSTTITTTGKQRAAFSFSRAFSLSLYVL